MQPGQTFLIAVLGGALATGCGKDGGPGTPPDAGGGPIDQSELTGKVVHQVTVQGIQRGFIVYLPESAATASNLPVVFMLHGTGGSGNGAFGNSNWKEKADAEQLIAVFPSALVHCYGEDLNSDGDTSDPGEEKVVEKWATGPLPPCTAEQLASLPPEKRAAADHPLADDVGFFDAMLELLGTKYSIDSRRVYVTGFSNGGSMTARLALERSTVIAAAASAAGFSGYSDAAARPMSVIAAVGQVDHNYTMSALPLRESLLTEVPELKARAVTPYLSVLQLADSYDYDERMVGGKKVIRFTFATSTAGASNSLQFIVLEGMDHLYANGTNYPYAYVDPFWSMFETQSLP